MESLKERHSSVLQFMYMLTIVQANIAMDHVNFVLLMMHIRIVDVRVRIITLLK